MFEIAHSRIAAEFVIKFRNQILSLNCYFCYPSRVIPKQPAKAVIPAEKQHTPLFPIDLVEKDFRYAEVWAQQMTA